MKIKSLIYNSNIKCHQSFDTNYTIKSNKLSKNVDEFKQSINLDSPLKVKKKSHENILLKIYKPLKSFHSNKEAFQYAKQNVIEALNSSQPYEKLIVVDGKYIMREKNGDFDNVGLDKISLMILPKTSKLIHGHPDFMPISFSDYEGLVEYNPNEIIAFNEKGELSSLTKKKNFSQEYIDNLSKYRQKYYIEVLDMDANKVNDMEYVRNFLNKYYKNQVKPEVIKKIHQFWENYANELGVIYKTNYSNLT